jgi:hypothetical protein
MTPAFSHTVSKLVLPRIGNTNGYQFIISLVLEDTIMSQGV